MKIMTAAAIALALALVSAPASAACYSFTGQLYTHRGAVTFPDPSAVVVHIQEFVDPLGGYIGPLTVAQTFRWKPCAEPVVGTIGPLAWYSAAYRTEADARAAIETGALIVPAHRTQMEPIGPANYPMVIHVPEIPPPADIDAASANIQRWVIIFLSPSEAVRIGSSH